MKDLLIAYVDGSYNPKYPNTVGSGVVLINSDSTIEEYSFSIVDEELAKQRNVGGELRSAMFSMQMAIEKGYKDLIIMYDYEGIEKWANKTWRAKNKYTQAYRNFVDEMRNYINIEFHKVQAHNGNEYNELADKLAKQSLKNSIK